MKDSVVLVNLVYYTFLGLTAYFVTPYVLLLLLVIQGFVTSKDSTKKDELKKQIKELELEILKAKGKQNAN